jgi:hypothetical protein
MRSLARRGAEVRLAELNEEIKAIHAAFPDLRRGAPPASSRRRRKPMSAAQKKAVSARMRKYWAERRKAQAKVK